MDKALWSIVALIVLVFLCSCSTTETNVPRTNVFYPTGIGADEGVAILLDKCVLNEIPQEKTTELESEEKSIENCVSGGMMKTNPGLKRISAKDFRSAVFQDKKLQSDSLRLLRDPDAPRSSGDLLCILRNNPDAQSRVMKLGVRYLVIVDIITYKGDSHADMHTAYGASVDTITYPKEADMKATVVDVKYLRESGTVSAHSSGKQGGGIGCVHGGQVCCAWPVFYFARPEANACSALGEGVMKFLILVPEKRLIIEGTPDTQTAPQPASEEDGPKGTFD